MPSPKASIKPARVAGGVAPLPEHSTAPKLQSPMAQAKLCAQSVRPHMQPDQPFVMPTMCGWPEESAKPVGGEDARPHGVRLELFVTVSRERGRPCSCSR
jgi:hypothetical protein